MTDIEQKALALAEAWEPRFVAPWPQERKDALVAIFTEHLRAIEQHEAFRRDVSDAVLNFKICYAGYKHVTMFDRFIIPKPVDPVENVMRLVRAVANVHVIEAAIRELVSSGGGKIGEGA